MSERALATIETITGVRPIDGADAIEAVTVRGWVVVTKKGEYQPGDRCVYIEIDSFLPVDDERFAFLAPRGTKTFDGRLGHVLKTAKLRGTISQGLVIDDIDASLDVGADVTEQLAIVKYEPPVPAELAGDVVGPFPTRFVAKTDAERVQNLSDHFDDLYRDGDWVATEKVDGSSMTVINDNGTIRVCSRNWELADTDNNTLWTVAKRDVVAWLAPGMWVQGELYGEGIQANGLGRRGHHFAVFGVGVGRNPLPRDRWPTGALLLAAPIYDLELADTVEGAITQADGIGSLITPGRNAEGIVWHDRNGRTFDTLDGRSCFKAISNRWLLKHDR